MAFTQGQLITASGLNVVNDGISISGNFPVSADWIQDYIGNNGIIYSHRPPGALLFHIRLDCGWFGGGKFRVVKWVNGGWNETLASSNYGWSTHTDVNVNSTGPGQYRIYFDTAAQFDSTSWQIYCGQTDCMVGKHLTVYDGFYSSLNTLPGTIITAYVCNSQRVGTLGTP